MALAIRVLQTAVVTGEDGTLALVSTQAVPAGATLVLIGAGVHDSATDVAPYLNSVADTQTNTWQTPINVRASGTYYPQVFAALAYNVAAGTPTVTGTFTQSVTDNLFSAALIEITGAPTASALETSVNATATSGTSITTAATGALSQAANALVACFGGWIGYPTNPGGWSSALTQNNGVNIGCQISYKTINDASSRTETFTTSEIAGGAILMLVIKQAAGAALRYKFEMDTTAFTSADTGIVGFVWKNATPDIGTAQKFTGLAGDATAGKLLIDTGLPPDVALSDTIYGIFYNDADTSGLITGTVEAA